VSLPGSDGPPASGTLPAVLGRPRLAPWLVALLLLLVAPARAARTNHLFLDESQLLPEGSVELEQWVWAYGRIPNRIDRPASMWLWWGPAFSVSNHLEFELPIQVVAVPDDTYLHSLSLVVRYRIFPREQDDGWQPLIRIAYQQPLDPDAGPPALETTLVLTIGSLQGIRTTFNAGVYMGMPFLQSSAPGEFSVLGRGGVGVSFPLGREWRLAGEFFGQLPIHGDTRPNKGQMYLGPSVAWTHGPFWITFGSLFGLTDDSSRYYPRVLWGIAL
jgi:hypothetical protein